MNREKFLPLGTVVLLKDAKKRLMIIGYAAKGSNAGNKMYDYVGCLYPEGLVSSDQNLLFNHDQIKEIYYMGYGDKEWIETEKKLKDIVDKIEKGNMKFPKKDE